VARVDLARVVCSLVALVLYLESHTNRPQGYMACAVRVATAVNVSMWMSTSVRGLAASQPPTHPLRMPTQRKGHSRKDAPQKIAREKSARNHVFVAPMGVCARGRTFGGEECSVRCSHRKGVSVSALVASTPKEDPCAASLPPLGRNSLYFLKFCGKPVKWANCNMLCDG
jgi:hypothetical protein